jgi:hypothetical protein
MKSEVINLLDAMYARRNSGDHAERTNALEAILTAAAYGSTRRVKDQARFHLKMEGIQFHDEAYEAVN